MNRSLRLDKAQRAALMQHYLSEADFPSRRRCHILLLLDDGFTVERVAQATDTTATQIQGYLRRFQRAGVQGVIRNSK